MTYPGSTEPEREGPTVPPASEPPRPGLISNPDFFREIPSLGPYTFEDSRPRDFDFMVMFLRTNIPGLTVSRAEDYVEQYATGWQEDYGVWPTVTQAASDPSFVIGGYKLPSWADYLPDVFVVIDETGQPVLYDNTTYAGPVPVTVPEENMPAQWRPTWDDPQQGALGFEHAAPVIPSGIPVISQAELEAVRQQWAQYVGSYGSGGGGGRTAPTFDRRQLEANIRDQWQHFLLEAPGDVEGMIDRFTAEATAFYLETGGQTSLSAWLMEQIRESSRYRLLYGHKPEGMSEDEYLGRVQTVVNRFGFDPSTTMQETVAGMARPVDLSSFAERLAGSQQYTQAHQGDLSQAFASTFRGLGVLRGS